MGLGIGAKLIERQAHKGGAWRCPRWPFTLRGGLLALGACLLAAAYAPAQQAAAQATPATDAAMGSVHGTVESADGTVYEGARVVLELTLGDDPETATQQTDSSGAFNFANLTAGTFKITVSSDGFQTQSISGELRAGEAYDTRTIVLPMAAAANSVEVSAGSQEEIAEAQLNLEEQQRVLGILPNYYVSYDPNALPLTTRQKFQLAWRTSIDPVTFLMTGTVAGMEQANHIFKGYGQGAEGYAKRFGANYADNFNEDMIGGAILPSLFRQDPRYFYKGTGSIRSRAMRAIASAVICKGDNAHWQFDYSGILGGIAAGGISDLYYPAGDRSGVEVTFENALIGTAAGAAQNLIQEFVIRRLTPRLPAYTSAQTP
ncbi:MAG: carboxypeptidase-like regulatory domain-containing protein [Terracidiphilus sp.]